MQSEQYSRPNLGCHTCLSYCGASTTAPPQGSTSDETASNQRANYMDALAQCQRANLRKEQTLHTKSKSQVYAWKHAEVRCECPAAASPGITDRFSTSKLTQEWHAMAHHEQTRISPSFGDVEHDLLAGSRGSSPRWGAKGTSAGTVSTALTWVIRGDDLRTIEKALQEAPLQRSPHLDYWAHFW